MAAGPKSSLRVSEHCEYHPDTENVCVLELLPYRNKDQNNRHIPVIDVEDAVVGQLLATTRVLLINAGAKHLIQTLLQKSGTECADAVKSNLQETAGKDSRFPGIPLFLPWDSETSVQSTMQKYHKDDHNTKGTTIQGFVNPLKIFYSCSYLLSMSAPSKCCMRCRNSARQDLYNCRCVPAYGALELVRDPDKLSGITLWHSRQ